jgi:ribosomal protein S24E
LEITSDSDNRLLSRREVVGTFAGGNGLITRQSAAEAISMRLGVKKEDVQVLSLRGKFGTRDLQVNAYVFSDEKSVKEQLPKYLSIRHLPTKDERKKAREELKKAKKPAPATASGGATAAQAPKKK